MIEERKATILIVDDDPQNRMLLRFFCKKWGFDVVECKNGAEAVKEANEKDIDIILMDLMMPKLDGFSALEVLKNNEKTKYIPVIILTAAEDTESRIKGIELGADDFFTKPINIHELKLRLKNSLKLKYYNDTLKNYNLYLENELKKKISEVKRAYIDSLYRLTKIAEYKDRETGDHLKRIGYFSKEVAVRLGLGSEFSENIYHASQMHDIGKVGIPEKILQKNGSLTQEEFEIMKKHTIIGADILKGSHISVLQMAEKIAKYHHEKWNGEGYPFRLKGESIPLSARIVALADIYDALRSERIYKPPLTHQQATEVILNGDNRTKPEHFDPEVLNIFRKYHRTFEEIYETVRAVS
ncbi:MAG TPA: two-component system response regulator [Persephonella sp.]|uniref:Response regulator receiver modulated metal dependent phosphohydrolase n=1 Tax=Persephonella marina (strain DSM 14350 / EX-H1) TaxID=123214 RepID=C0QRG6_PERMH|nr:MULTISPECIES: HD domain-containing phosphohydrolase [Persephonella]ACO03464.1 response regulator receiver modulated metal dependent phosphohydrolase [Persephonella marina EX-H1]HCB69008.1 two-component system response regulator [Persephonella sp.]